MTSRPRSRSSSCSASARCSSASASSTPRRSTRCCSARCSGSARPSSSPPPAWRSSACSALAVLYRPLLLSSVLPEQQPGARVGAVRDRARLSGHRRAGDDDDRAGRRHRAHLQPDDRPAGGGADRSPPAHRRPRALDRDRARHRLGGDRLSYETNWPVGFFVGMFSASAYACARVARAPLRRRPARTASPDLARATDSGFVHDAQIRPPVHPT